jgi:hypothetical protein
MRALCTHVSHSHMSILDVADFGKGSSNFWSVCVCVCGAECATGDHRARAFRTLCPLQSAWNFRTIRITSTLVRVYL